jgi:hypothetical protein
MVSTRRARAALRVPAALLVDTQRLRAARAALRVLFALLVDTAHRVQGRVHLVLLVG